MLQRERDVERVRPRRRRAKVSLPIAHALPNHGPNFAAYRGEQAFGEEEEKEVVLLQLCDRRVRVVAEFGPEQRLKATHRLAASTNERAHCSCPCSTTIFYRYDMDARRKLP